MSDMAENSLALIGTASSKKSGEGSRMIRGGFKKETRRKAQTSSADALICRGSLNGDRCKGCVVHDSVAMLIESVESGGELLLVEHLIWI